MHLQDIRIKPVVNVARVIMLPTTVHRIQKISTPLTICGVTT